MHRFALLTFSALALFALQTGILPFFLDEPFRPNLPLIIVVCLGLRSEWTGAGVAAYGIGLLQDCFSGLYFGLNAFTCLIVFLVLRALADNLYASRTSVLLFCVAIATAGVGLMHILLLTLFSVGQGIYAPVLFYLLPQVTINAFVASLVPLFSPLQQSEGEQQ